MTVKVAAKTGVVVAETEDLEVPHRQTGRLTRHGRMAGHWTTRVDSGYVQWGLYSVLYQKAILSEVHFRTFRLY